MLINRLPGEPVPYFLKAGCGEQTTEAGHAVTRIARAEDTGGLFEAAIWSGGRGCEVASHRHVEAQHGLVVLRGRLDLHLDGRTYRMADGDFASIPPGAVHGHTVRGHRTQFLLWTTGGAAADMELVAAQGAEGAENGTEVPAGRSAYVLECGEGERMIAGDQLFAFLAHQGNSDGRFISLTTRGPKGDRIPRHFHEKHTECFYCLEGAMTMWAGDEEIALGPGDFLHVPAGTIHAYRLDAPYNNFLGILAPGIFEPFFRTLCDPYPGHDFPSTPWPFRFDRVLAKLGELDLKLVERPGRP